MRRATGTMTYTYEFDKTDMFMQQLGKHTDDESIRRYFVAQMVEDIINNAYGDLAPCIEMEITDVE